MAQENNIKDKPAAEPEVEKSAESAAKGAPEASAAEETAGKAREDKAADKKAQESRSAASAAGDASEELTKKLAEAQDKYVRMAAEFENFRRRTAKEKLDLVKSAGENILKGMLPVLDDCERAIAQLAATEASTFEKEGTGLIYSKLLSYMKSCGLEEIQVLGMEYDADSAEAVAMLPVQEPDKKGVVLEVVVKGYTLGGKVIRFPKVVVGQ